MPKLIASGLSSMEFTQHLESGKDPLAVPGGAGSGTKLAAGNLEASVKLSFSNLTAHVGIPNGGKKVIMDGITGSAHTRQVMAVMGATGCGKTTFLSALGNRLDPSVAVSDSSQISYGGQAWSPALKRRVGFIEQDDVTFPHLTVRQALTFAARLRLSGTDEQRAQRVEELIGQMKLEKCADALIGGGMLRGVSGGERKRVCIATELISKPTFLFCDEPTSGLDSETALVIIEVLQELTCDAGMCIICSIHQPSSQVYAQFDDLCFLDGGRCVYFGKAGETAISFFSAATKSVCPAKYNPPDWFMEKAVRGNLAGIKMDVEITSNFHVGSFEAQDRGFAVPFGEQVAVIFARSWEKTKVQKLTTPFYLQNIIIGLVMGTLFIGLGDDESDIFPRVSVAFNFLMGAIYLPIMEVLFVFLEDSSTLRKDLLVKAHHPFAYFVARTLSVAPVLGVLLMLMKVSTYILTFYKYGSFEQFFTFLAAQFLVGSIFGSLGICVAAFVQNPAYLMTTTMILFVWLISFSGFFVPTSSIMPALRWMVAINPASYGFALFFQVILKVGVAPSFSCDELSSFKTCDAVNSNGKITPDDVLEHYSMDTPIETCFAALLGMFAFCFAIGYYCFKQKVAKWLQ